MKLLILAVGFFGLEFLTTPAFAQDAEKIQEMQRLIGEQQKQLEALQKQLDAQRKMLQELQSQREPPAKEVTTTVQAPVEPVEKVVTSGEERVKLSISGQVNRAVNIVDDGKDTDAFFVDNDNAESRIKFVGTAKVNDDLTIDSTIELTIAPDKAGEVSQNDKEPGDVFDQRLAEVSLDSKRFGKLSLMGQCNDKEFSDIMMISYAQVLPCEGLGLSEIPHAQISRRVIDQEHQIKG